MATWTEASFVGGHPVLDFVNTVAGRTRERETELLPRFLDAADWAYAAGVIDHSEQEQLGSRTHRHPTEAAHALVELQAQREALHAFLWSGVAGTECPPSVLVRVHADVLTAQREATLSERFDTHPAWIVDVTTVGCRLLARRLALASAALLSGEQRLRIAGCGRCSWLFLDASPSRRRRWCSMATCGNRAKVERHHRRKR